MLPFILEKEKTFFHRIDRILSRHLTHPVAQTILGWQRELFSGRDARWQMTITLDGVVLNSEALSANMSETVTPWEFRVEGEQESEPDEHRGADPRWAGDRGRSESYAATVHAGVQAEDRSGGRQV